MNRLIIIGAGGHGKVIADAALKNGYTDIRFVDDSVTGQCMGFPIVGGTSAVAELNDGHTDFVIGIGDNTTRQSLAERYDVPWTTLIHPSAQIGTQVSLGKGTVILAGAVVNVCATVGEHCIINTGAIVEHDNVLGDYVHISPGVTLSGTVSIGDRTWIGTGTSVIHNVTVCEDVVVGVGSVVIRNIETKGTYYGIVS